MTILVLNETETQLVKKALMKDLYSVKGEYFLIKGILDRIKNFKNKVKEGQEL